MRILISKWRKHGATISSITLSPFDTSTVPLGRSPFSFFLLVFYSICGNFWKFCRIYIDCESQCQETLNARWKKECWTTNHMWKSFLAISVIDDVLFVRWLCLHLSSLLLPLYEPSRNRFWLLASISRSVLRGYFNIYCHSTLHYHHNKWWQGTFSCTDAIFLLSICSKCECEHVQMCSFFFCLVLPLRRANGKFLVALIRAIQKCKIALRIKHAW